MRCNFIETFWNGITGYLWQFSKFAGGIKPDGGLEQAQSWPGFECDINHAKLQDRPGGGHPHTFLLCLNKEYVYYVLPIVKK